MAPIKKKSLHKFSLTLSCTVYHKCLMNFYLMPVTIIFNNPNYTMTLIHTLHLSEKNIKKIHSNLWIFRHLHCYSWSLCSSGMWCHVDRRLVPDVWRSPLSWHVTHQSSSDTVPHLRRTKTMFNIMCDEKANSLQYLRWLMGQKLLTLYLIQHGTCTCTLDSSSTIERAMCAY
jgi:hypothetical protein